MQSLSSDYFRSLGERRTSDLPLLSAGEVTNWDTRVEVWGRIVGTEALTVALPSHKRFTPHSLLAEWPASRASASAKQVSQLASLLVHISFAVRPGAFCLHRLLASVEMPRMAAGTDFAGLMASPGRLVALWPESHRDLEFRRWFAEVGVDARGGALSAPMYNLLERPPQRTLLSDAPKTAVGTYSFGTGVYLRYDLSVQEQSQFNSSNESVDHGVTPR